MAEQTQPKVWTSNVWFSAQTVRYWGYPLPERGARLDALRDRLHAHYHGGALAPQDFPDKVYLTKKGDRRPLPCMFTITGGLLATSVECAEILTQFDLGQTKVHMVDCLDFDQKTPTGQRMAILNITETKDCFLPEQTVGTEPLTPGLYRLNTLANDYKAVAVRATAAEGVDLWVAPNLSKAPFFSDRLAKAIKAGPFKRVALKPCIVMAEEVA